MDTHLWTSIVELKVFRGRMDLQGVHFILVLTCLSTSLSSSVLSDQGDRTTQERESSIQPCNLTYDHGKSFLDRDGMFENHAGILATRYNESWVTNVTSSPICYLDVQNLLFDDMTAEVAFVYFTIRCDRDSRMQIHFTNPTGLLAGLPITVLHFVDCQSTLENIGFFGQIFDLRSLVLVNWSEGKQVNTSCENLPDKFFPRSPIPGLENVGTLSIIQRDTFLSSIPCEFYTHQWPLMGELHITNISVREDLANKFEYSMPLLQSLDIEYNPLSALPAFPWKGHTRLQLPRNLNRTLKGNAHYSGGLTVPRNLYRRTFFLNYSNLTNITDYQFTGAYDSISLIGCGIKDITNTTFNRVSELQFLVLSKNYLTDIPTNSFLSLANLKTLKLDENNLKRLQSNAFNGLHMLSELHLEKNDLELLEDNVFSSLHSLKKLLIHSNKLHTISPIIFSQGLRNQLEVDFSKNNVSRFPSWAFTTSNLTKLDLSNNCLTFEALVSDEDINPRQITLVNRLSANSPDRHHTKAINKEIILKKNKFHKLNFKVFKADEQKLERFKTVLTFYKLVLAENDLQCDCDALAFRNYLINVWNVARPDEVKNEKMFPFSSHLSEWICFTPQDIRGTNLLQAANRSFFCEKALANCPPSCICFERLFDHTVIVNCSERHLNEMPDKLPNMTDTLLLDHNNIKNIKMTYYYKNLKHLNLSFNQLETIDDAEKIHLSGLTSLNLNNNRLKYLPTSFKRLYQVAMTLEANDFQCDCHSAWLQQWMIYANVTDKDRVVCASGLPGTRISMADRDDFVCELAVAEVASISMAVVLFISLLTMILLYKYRGEIKVLLYFHLKWHPFDRSENTDLVDKLYDAFVSYSKEDVNIVFDVLQPGLETQTKPYRLCIHERDFAPGGLITDNVLYSVKYSRRMILLLTKNFLKSEWCHLEFQSAHRRVLKDRTNYLVVILCDKIKVDDLDEALKLYLKTNTYIEYDSKWFWQRLFYAMPERSLAELRQEGMPSDGYRVLMPKPETVAIMKKSTTNPPETVAIMKKPTKNPPHQECPMERHLLTRDNSAVSL